MQSLDLVFDDETDTQIRACWQELLDADLPSQARHMGPSNRPHVTMLTRSTITVTPEAADLLPKRVTIGPIVLLGSPASWVVARLVVPSSALLQLHARLHAGAELDDGDGHDAPDRWTPHVTLARKVAAADIGRVLAVCGDVAPFAASVVGLRHWDSATRVETRLV